MIGQQVDYVIVSNALIGVLRLISQAFTLLVDRPSECHEQWNSVPLTPCQGQQMSMSSDFE